MTIALFSEEPSVVTITTDDLFVVTATMEETPVVTVLAMPGDTGPEGPQGPPGPPGSDGAGFNYVHDQVMPSDTWIVIHDLGGYPNVTSVDTAGTVIIGGVVYDSVNQLTLTFSLPVNGKAYVS